ncbi:hypothetical protein Pst134EB_004220 [Puccinia striiformis f. sp. tritici]|nr:hypothetical protein Pst134EB_004220 [Puccinia striiformis f. sp. tritici]
MVKRLDLFFLGSSLLHSAFHFVTARLSHSPVDELYFSPEFKENIGKGTTTTGDEYLSNDHFLPPSVIPNNIQPLPENMSEDEYRWDEDKVALLLDSISSEPTSPIHGQNSHQVPDQDNSRPNSPTPDNRIPYRVTSKSIEGSTVILQRPTKKRVRVAGRGNPSKKTEKRPGVRDLIRKQISDKLQEKVQRKPFDVSEVKLKTFGWISTLKYPAGTQLDHLNGVGTMLRASKIYEIIDDTRDSNVVLALLDRLVAISEVTMTDALYRMKGLLRELCVRHVDFVAAFTTTQEEAISTADQSPSNMIRIQEQINLLSWLLGELEMNNVDSSGVDRALDGEELSPLQWMIIEHLKLIPKEEGIETGRWRTNPPKTRPSRIQYVSVQKASMTQLAINILGSYYKSANPKKWELLFMVDHSFVDLFLSLKCRVHNANFGKTPERDEQWASLTPFPWTEPLHFENDKPSDEFMNNLVSVIQILRRPREVKMEKQFVTNEAAGQE